MFPFLVGGDVYVAPARQRFGRGDGHFMEAT